MVNAMKGSASCAAAFAMALVGCAAIGPSDADVLEVRSPAGDLHQKVLYLGECRFRVISPSPHETSAMEFTRERVGEYVSWSYGAMQGLGPMYFPVPYDGRTTWEVDGVTFKAEAMDYWQGVRRHTVHRVRAVSWGPKGFSLVFSAGGDYLGAYSDRVGFLGMADVDKAAAFQGRCRPADAEPPTLDGMHYSEARAALLSRGWTPVQAACAPNVICGDTPELAYYLAANEVCGTFRKGGRSLFVHARPIADGAIIESAVDDRPCGH